MKTKLLVLIILCLSDNIHAQLQLTLYDEFCFKITPKLFGEGAGNNFIPSGNGGFIVVGSTKQSSIGTKQHHGMPMISTNGDTSWNDDAYIGKMNSDFVATNANIYGGTFAYDYNDIFNDIYPQSDGGFVMFGSSGSIDGDIQSPTACGMLLMKVDSNLNPVWSKPYGCATQCINPVSSYRTNDGGYIMIGVNNGLCGDIPTFYGLTPFEGDWIIVKTDSMGNKEWAKVKGSSNDEHSAVKILQDNAGYYYIIGQLQDGDHDCIPDNANWHTGILTGNDIYIMKLDSLGDKIWTKSYGGSDVDWVGASYYDSLLNRIIIGGGTRSTDFLFNGMQTFGGGDALLLTLDTAGSVKSKMVIGGSQVDNINSIQLRPEDHTYVLGINTRSNDGDMTGYCNHGIAYPDDLFICSVDTQNNFVMKYGVGTDGANNIVNMKYYNGFLYVSAGLSKYTPCVCDTNTTREKYVMRKYAFAPLGIIEPIKKYEDIKIYPNPSNGLINIEIPVEYIEGGNIEISIHDMQGNVIKEVEKKASIKMSLEIKNGKNGEYIISIENKKIQKFSRKIIIHY